MRIKLNPANQNGDLLDAEHITAGRDVSTAHHAESTFIEIFHTPQAG